jgi:hypothetical protein
MKEQLPVQFYFHICIHYSVNLILTVPLNILFIPGLWIRIGIGSGFSDLVDPDPYWESGSRIRGQEN